MTVWIELKFNTQVNSVRCDLRADIGLCVYPNRCRQFYEVADLTVVPICSAQAACKYKICSMLFANK